MTGRMLLACSEAYLRGLATGYRHAGHSPWRRFAMAVSVWAVLTGTGLGFLWASADLFFRLRTDDPVTKVLVGKFEAWNRIYGPPRQREGR